MELQFNEPLFNDVLGITNNIKPAKVTVKFMEKNLYLTNINKKKILFITNCNNMFFFLLCGRIFTSD